jgi:hypothetical protein
MKEDAVEAESGDFHSRPYGPKSQRTLVQPGQKLLFETLARGLAQVRPPMRLQELVGGVSHHVRARGWPLAIPSEAIPR